MTEDVWKLIDRDATLARLAGDEGLLRELAGYFLEDYGKHFNTVTQGVANADAAAVERGAHSLKGMAANLGATDVAKAAAELEGLGRKRDLTAASAAAQALKREIDRLVGALSAYHDTDKS